MQYEDYQTFLAILDGRGPERAIQHEGQLRMVMQALQPRLDRYIAAALDVTTHHEHADAFTVIFNEVKATVQSWRHLTVRLEHIIKGIEYGVYHVAHSFESHGQAVRDGYLHAARAVTDLYQSRAETPIRMAVNELRDTVERSPPEVEMIMLALRASRGGLSHRSFG
jgi:hypothetical protein